MKSFGSSGENWYSELRIRQNRCLADMKGKMSLCILNGQREIDKGRNHNDDHAGDQRNGNRRFEKSCAHTSLRGELQKIGCASDGRFLFLHREMR